VAGAKRDDLAIRLVSQVSVNALRSINSLHPETHTAQAAVMHCFTEQYNQCTRAHETTQSVAWHTRAAAW